MLHIPKRIPLILNFLKRPQHQIRNYCFNITPPHYGSDRFEVLLNVRNYKLNQLSVRLVENTIIIDGKREEQYQDDYISREFLQEYILPVAYDTKKISSKLTSDGILHIMIPPLLQNISQIERIIDIHKI